MKKLLFLLILCGAVSGRAQSPAPAGSALERVQQLIYGSNQPPAPAPAPVSHRIKAPAPAAPDWDLFLSKPNAATNPKPSAEMPPPLSAAEPTQLPPVTPIVVTTTPAPTAKSTVVPSIAEGEVKSPRIAASQTTPVRPTPKGAEDFRFSPPPESDAESQPPNPTAPGGVANSVPTGTSDNDSLLDDKHKLSPGDKLSFQILEDRDPVKSLLVTDSGEVDVPYLGRVRATDKTCRQLGQELKAQLEQKYYYRASVVLGLDAASKVRGKIYIWGQVRQQGAIDIPTGENFTVGKAVLRAGGFADFANKKKVKLVRAKPDGTKESFELNMVDVLEKAKMEADLTVQEDDFIIVPSRLINF